MGLSPAVLAVTIAGDEHADAIEAVLNRLGARLVRLDFSQFPARKIALSPANEPDKRVAFGGELLSGCTAVWYRRIAVPRPGADLDSGEARWVIRETQSALRAGLRLVPAHRWVNDPNLTERWELKAVQLALARDYDIRVPATVITNSPDAARDFLAKHKSAVAKAVHQAYIPLLSGPRAGYTVPLDRDSEMLDSIAESPVTIQERIEKRADIRATFVGRRFLSARLPTSPEAPIDWRQSGVGAWEPFELPPEFAHRLARMMAETGLHFGALDLIEHPSGDLIFLEMNPSGQWLWLDDQLGIGITQAIGEVLMAKDDSAKVRWPSAWKHLWHDLLPDPLVPENDGLVVPEFTAPSAIEGIPDDQVELVRDGFARLAKDAEDRADTAQAKAARIVSFVLFLLPAALSGVVFFLQKVSAERELMWAGVGFCLVASAFAIASLVFGLEADRVGLYSRERVRLNASNTRIFRLGQITSLWHARRLADLTADRKFTLTMKARAWATKSGVCLIVAAVLAALAFGLPLMKHYSNFEINQGRLVP